MEDVLLAVATAEDIKAVLTALKTIADFMLEQVTALVDLVVSQPLLLIPIGVVMVRTVISIFRSLF